MASQPAVADRPSFRFATLRLLNGKTVRIASVVDSCEVGFQYEENLKIPYIETSAEPTMLESLPQVMVSKECSSAVRELQGCLGGS